MVNAAHPGYKGRFAQRLCVSISTLQVGSHMCRDHTAKLSKVAKIVNSTIKMFSARRHTHIVSHVDTCGVIHS